MRWIIFWLAGIWKRIFAASVGYVLYKITFRYMPLINCYSELTAYRLVSNFMNSDMGL